jgi:hypothetical protein
VDGLTVAEEFEVTEETHPQDGERGGARGLPTGRRPSMIGSFGDTRHGSGSDIAGARGANHGAVDSVKCLYIRVSIDAILGVRS